MRRSPGVAASLAARCVVIATAITVLTGCSTAYELSLGHGVESCAPVASGAQFVVGDVAVAPAGGDIRLSSVRLAESDGVELSEAYLLPIDDTGSIGAAEFPPTMATWDKREPVEDSVIEAGESMNIVLVVRRTSAGSDATIDGIHVEYESGWLHRTAESSMRYVLADSCF